MLLLTLLIFLARSAGSPTSPAAHIPSTPHLLRRAPWDHPNPDTGLCDCPNTRSLAEIVWTCASTLILATWVTVHLNVPAKGASPFRLVVLRFGAMFSAILGPEVTLRWAIVEWNRARKLQEEMVQKYPRWTITHSFYVVMGGFVLYDKKQGIYCPVHPKDFPTDVEAKFALPKITEEEIKDKSKGDGLTKTIAVFQLLWFSVQLIGRLVKGWAATELEVLTFATCIMTVAIYFFWWNKPLDVHCQTVLEPILAGEEGIDDGNDSVTPKKGREYPSIIRFFKQFRFFTSHPIPQHKFHCWIFEYTSPLTLFLKVLVFPFLFLSETLGWDDPSWGPDCANPVSAIHQNETDLLDDQPLMLMFLFASAFGGLHFITWSFSMPTVTELWMWRSSSIALTSFPILAPLCGQVSLPRHFKSIGILLDTFATFLVILHPLIRLIIAVDSVVLLRSLPDTAFLVLSWSDAIPSF